MNKPPSEAASTDILLRDLQMRQIELELQNENLRQTKAALAASEARWKFAIEGAGDGLWDWSIQTGKAFYSTRYKAMLAFAEDDIGDTADEWVKRIHPDDAPEVFSTMRPSGATAVEFRMQRQDGSWQWTSGRGMVVERDAQGMPLRMIGTNSDISERKHAEAQLQRAATRAGQSHARRGASPWRHLSQRAAPSSQCVVVRLIDDGCGFDSTLGSNRGRGLGIMAERALAIGARLRISSQPGSTIVEIEIDV